MKDFVDISIVGVIEGEVGSPRGDGSAGSALYAVPVRLSATPPPAWSTLAIQHWDSPPAYTQMHRPHTARVDRDRFILERTTVDEVAQYHAKTLALVVSATNASYRAHLKSVEAARTRAAAADEAHRRDVSDGIKRIKFDQSNE